MPLIFKKTHFHAWYLLGKRLTGFHAFVTQLWIMKKDVELPRHARLMAKVRKKIHISTFFFQMNSKTVIQFMGAVP